MVEMGRFGDFSAAPGRSARAPHRLPAGACIVIALLHLFRFYRRCGYPLRRSASRAWETWRR
jgi:hypothetical protein